MFRRFVPLFGIAFLTGLLFRMADQYGIAALRMFGTWGIVVIGVWGARILRTLQLEDGIRRVEEHFTAMEGRVRVTRLFHRGTLPLWIVETDKGKIVLGASGVPNSMKWTRASRSLGMEVRKMLERAHRSGAISSAGNVTAALVLLRKGVGPEAKLTMEDGRSVLLVNPENIGQLVQVA